MAVTRAEIANRALRRCGKLAFSQTATSDLTDEALQAYDEAYSYLEELGLVDWGSTASVPNEYVFWVVAMTAYSMADTLGVPSERYQRIALDARSAESEIRRIKANYYTPNEIKVSDY